MTASDAFYTIIIFLGIVAFALGINWSKRYSR